MADVVFRQQAWRDLETIYKRIRDEDPSAAETLSGERIAPHRLVEKLP